MHALVRKLHSVIKLFVEVEKYFSWVLDATSSEVSRNSLGTLGSSLSAVVLDNWQFREYKSIEKYTKEFEKCR